MFVITFFVPVFYVRNPKQDHLNGPPILFRDPESCPNEACKRGVGLHTRFGMANLLF